MRKFITYFDYLGFKDFILNNDLEYQSRIIGNIFRDIENSLGKGKLKEARHGVIADLSESGINCLNFSDTVVFWTNNDSIESLKELIEVTYKFNWQAIKYFFPARGVLIYGEIIHVDFRKKNEGGGIYNINSIFGKGIVEAYTKSEQQNWAGTVIDKSVIEFLNYNKLDPTEFLSNYAKRYRVPYKDGVIIDEEEYAFSLVKGTLNEEAYKNIKNNIERNFAEHKKDITHSSVKVKLENTIKYLESFKEDVRN